MRPKASLIYKPGKVTPSLFDNQGMRLSSRRLQWRLQTYSYVFCGFHVSLRCGLRSRQRTVLGCRAPSHVDRVSLKWWRISLRLGERVHICWHDRLDVYERDLYVDRWTGPGSQSSLLMWLCCCQEAQRDCYEFRNTFESREKKSCKSRLNNISLLNKRF